MNQRRFVMLDRDGTMIVERHYLAEPDLVELLPGVGPALLRLSALGFGLVGLTNQSPIGRGIFDEARLALIHHRLYELLDREGVRLDGMYHCPHVPDDRCLCRKPEPGMVERAAAELGFDPTRAFMIGDKRCDIDLGSRVGAVTFLVRTGYGAMEERSRTLCADHVVNDLKEAVKIIECMEILK